MPPSQKTRMSLKNLLPLSLLAIFAGLSLYYFSASNVSRVSVRLLPDGRPFYSIHGLAYNIRKTNEVADDIKKFHDDKFRFTTEELATHPEAKAVVEFLLEPLQEVIALGSDIDLHDCTATAHLLETCAVWSISANTAPATARPFLYATNARVHRCVEALDKIKQQHAFLEHLTQRLVDGDKGFVIANLPLPESASNQEALEQDFSARLSSFQNSAITTSWQLRDWNTCKEKSGVEESLASIRKSFADTSENIAAAAGRCDVGLAEELPVLLKACSDERSLRRRR